MTTYSRIAVNFERFCEVLGQFPKTSLNATYLLVLKTRFLRSQASTLVLRIFNISDIWEKNLLNSQFTGSYGPKGKDKKYVQ